MLSEIDKEIFREIILSDGYVSSINLATICNVSINTIRKSVDNINDFLSNKYFFYFINNFFKYTFFYFDKL